MRACGPARGLEPLWGGVEERGLEPQQMLNLIGGGRNLEGVQRGSHHIKQALWHLRAGRGDAGMVVQRVEHAAKQGPQGRDALVHAPLEIEVLERAVGLDHKVARAAIDHISRHLKGRLGPLER